MKRKIVLTGIIKCMDEYLIVQRSKTDDFLPGVWEFPGGNIEENETILEALKRELKEEIGYEIDTNNAKIIHFYDEIKDNLHYIELDFLIKVNTKDINIKLSNEHDDYKWVTKKSNLLDEFIKEKIKDVEE